MNCDWKKKRFFCRPIFARSSLYLYIQKILCKEYIPPHSWCNWEGQVNDPVVVPWGTTSDNNDGEILLLAHALGGEGFKDMTTKDVEELLTDCPLDDDELRECMDKQEDSDNSDTEMDLTKLDEGIKMSEKLAEFFIDDNPRIERAASFKNDLKYCIARYKELHKKLTNVNEQQGNCGKSW